MQKQLIKNIYQEFVYCDPNDHLLKPNNNLTKPEHNCKKCMVKNCPNDQFIKIQSDITGHYNKVIQNITPMSENIIQTTPELIQKKNVPINEPESETKHKEVEKYIYDEDTFNQIELRGFITKDLLKQSLEKGSNLFHIGKEIFDELHNKYHEFKEILHTLTTEFDNTIECIIETGKELTKKINHIIYQLYLAVMDKRL